MAYTKKNNGSAAKKSAESISSTESVIEKKNTVAKKVEKLPMDTLVPCVSMIKLGELIYQSKRQIGYRVVWDSYMSERLVELSELVAMKSNALDFFKENWIIIPDSFEYKDQVIKFLQIGQYYASTPDPYTLKDLFILPVDEMSDRINNMSASARDGIKKYVIDAVANGEVDSLKRIRALESALNCKLT